MSWNFNFLDHTADIAFEIEADSLDELFIASAAAFKKAVIEDYFSEEKEEKTIRKSESSLEELLVTFLDELNFLLETRKWIISEINKIKISELNKEFYLVAEISGEPVNIDKHHLKEEIKAVTFHQMEVKKVNNKFRTNVVFDI